MPDPEEEKVADLNESSQDITSSISADTINAVRNIQIIQVNQAFYKFKKELARGPFGLVYLYKSNTGCYQLVSKIFKDEINMQNDMQSFEFSSLPQQIEFLSMSEVDRWGALYSIEEYLKINDIPNKISFTDIFIQMVKEVEEMHRHGFVHHDIKPGNYRIVSNRVMLGYFKTDGRHKKILWTQRL
jgi:serine/threonine protein kinase